MSIYVTTGKIIINHKPKEAKKYVQTKQLITN